jgi:hypothetical protein
MSEAYKGIKRRVAAILRGRGIRGRTPEYVGPIQEMSLWTSAITPQAPVETESQEDNERTGALERAKTAIQVDCRQRWKERWKRSKKGPHSRILQPCLDPKVKKIHKSLRRHQSSLAIQLRTGKVGFRAFLFNSKVPDIETPWCLTCAGEELETVQHVLLHCPTWAGLREECFESGLKEGVRPSLKALLNTERGCRAATRMVQSTGLLKQYELCSIEESWQEPAGPDPGGDEGLRIRG